MERRGDIFSNLQSGPPTIRCQRVGGRNTGSKVRSHQTCLYETYVTDLIWFKIIATPITSRKDHTG